MSDNWWDEEADSYHQSTNRGQDIDGPGVNDLPPPPPAPAGAPPANGAADADTAAVEAKESADKKSADELTRSVSTESTYESDDDDEEEEEEQEWVTCEDVNHKTRFWIHADTKAISLADPKTLVGDGASTEHIHTGASLKSLVQSQSMQFGMKLTPAPGAVKGGSSSPLTTVVEEGSTDLLTADDVTIRRNSMIVSSAWDDSAADSAAATTHTDVTGMKKKRKRKNTTAADAMGTLDSISRMIDGLIDNCDELPESIAEDLLEVRTKIVNIHRVIEEEEEAEDASNDVEALLERKRLPWTNYDNVHVAGYRAAAAAVSHSDSAFSDWHFPQYFSDFPVPKDKKKKLGLTGLVRLPPGADRTMTHTRIHITEDNTVMDAIQQVFKQFRKLQGDNSALGPPDDYVLKANGLRDFMDPSNKLFNYEYVRSCMRDHDPVDLIMMKRPVPGDEKKGGLPVAAKNKDGDEAEVKVDLAAEYRKKVDPTIKPLDTNQYVNMTVKKGAYDQLESIPLSELALPFKVRICGCENVSQAGLPRFDTTMSDLHVRMFMFHGVKRLDGSARQTVPVPAATSPRWMEWLNGAPNKAIYLNKMPRETRICFLLYGTIYEQRTELLGWVTVQLIDEFGQLVQGRKNLRLWPIGLKEKEADLKFLFRATTRDNLADLDAAQLTVQFDEFLLPVVAPLREEYRAPLVQAVGMELPLKSLDKQTTKRLAKLQTADPLYEMEQADRQCLWMARHHYIGNPRVLPHFLESVDWSDKEHRMEAYRLLNQWKPPQYPVHMLELLDAKYANYRVREHAVNTLRSLSDDELQLYLLQLTQCIKFEPYHDSPLVRFLIQRSLRSPYQIGHYFFWHLKAEMAGSADFCERYAAILEEYLSHGSNYTHDLRRQHMAVLKLQRVAELIVKLKTKHKMSDSDCMKEYHKELHKLNKRFFSKIGKFQIPLQPKLEATTLIVEKCRYMSSKKVPLWLVFNNADAEAPPIYIIFKSGDDLRQDILTLQLLKLMDKIWLADGLDMRLKPYRCIATGVNDEKEGVGMIEVVMNSDTTSGIQLKYGGGAIGALKLEPLDLFIREHNKGPQYNVAVENFMRSCAGYCVATYVLGIGDRHNGNIMVTKDGHLFHIDFGHFLGNFKKKFGFNRERAAFVFTPEMAYVMGGKKYKKSEIFKRFKELCCDAYSSLRKHANLLENMFLLMVSAGMPELMVAEDVHYLRDKLCLDKSDKDAEKAFKKEIKKSLDTTWRRIDNWIHNAKHG
eukprot:TRINITY_DN66000_c6_g18_i1.p1 TRINITY_DN66000_c6_g18~~TRINITY_DN66000_c6_g18_i1.p1  ORF type:complete len:1249 (-),score=825.13 TRINITY_DN66000_c6_g18_i1:300-4046(-)